MRQFLIVIPVCVLSILLSPDIHATTISVDEISAKWTRWLEEEVVHIISSREKEIFLKLETEEQRELFKQQFWESRDPTPGTRKNEFQEEHFRRIEYADRMFRHASARRGALTARGRIYILLGPPRSTQSYPNSQNMYPMELWFCEGDLQKNLPSFFYLLFFQRFGAGDYELYNPVSDGPQALMPTINPRVQPIDKLRDIDVELARAAVNYLAAGDTGSEGQTSMSSLNLLYKIDQAREMNDKIEYAERILLGAETVTAEYSFATTDYPHEVFSSTNELNLHFVDFFMQIPPEDIKLGQYKDNVYGAFQLDFRLADQKGNIVYSDTEEVDLEYSVQDFESIRNRAILFEKRIPVVPGNYLLGVTFSNDVIKERTLLSLPIQTTAQPEENFAVGEILLAKKLDQINYDPASIVQPLQFGNIRLLPNTPGDYSSVEPLQLYMQLSKPGGFAQDNPEPVKVRYSILSEDGTEKTSGEREISSQLFSANGLFHFFMRWPLDDFSPGEYSLMITVEPGSLNRAFVRNTSFIVRAGSSPEPLLVSSKSILLQSQEYLLSLGKLWDAAGNIENAKAFVMAALSKDPDSLESRLFMSELFLKSGGYKEVINILQPVLVENPNNVELLRTCAQAYNHLKEHGKATKMLLRLILNEGESTEILNMLGAVYFNDGKKELAIEAWQRSLQLEPDQDKIVTILENIKMK